MNIELAEAFMERLELHLKNLPQERIVKYQRVPTPDSILHGTKPEFEIARLAIGLVRRGMKHNIVLRGKTNKTASEVVEELQLHDFLDFENTRWKQIAKMNMNERRGR